MIPVTVAAPVVADLRRRAQGVAAKGHQQLQRTRLQFDVLSQAGPRVDGPQVRYREYDHQLLILLRPSPHERFIVAPANGGYLVAGSAPNADGAALDRAALAVAARLHTAPAQGLDWQRLRGQIPAVRGTERLILDALAQLVAQRFLHGVSPAQLAQRMHVTAAQLAKIERIDTLPSLPTLQRYADALGVDLALQVAE